MLFIFQKNSRVRKTFCPQFWGRKRLRQSYERLEKLFSFCRKTSMPIKFLVLGGRILLFFFVGGGGRVPILFLWVWGFFWILLSWFKARLHSDEGQDAVRFSLVSVHGLILLLEFPVRGYRMLIQFHTCNDGSRPENCSLWVQCLAPWPKKFQKEHGAVRAAIRSSFTRT